MGNAEVQAAGDADALIKIKSCPARELAARCDLSDDARALLHDDPVAPVFINRLAAANQHLDAIHFMAHALPKREAVWWACLCVRSTLGQTASPDIVKALTTAEQWVYKPTDANGQLAMTAAEATDFSAPASWAAVAACWSGTNMSPQGNPPVAPGDDLSGKAVSGAVTLAAVMNDPDGVEARYQGFLSQGLDLARGGSGRGEESGSG